MKLETALELRRAGRLEEALQALGTSSEFDPQLSSVRAEIEFALGRFGDAALNYFAVTMADPENADLHYNLALCLACCERWDLAAEAFERVLRLDAERADARLGLGSSLLHLHRAEEALVNFTRCGAGTALFGKAVALQSLERFEEAGRMYEAVLVADPDSEEALSNLIAMSVERRDFERTSDYAARLLEICQQSTVALQGLAAAAFGKWDHPAAASYCDRILELAPDNLEAWHNFRVAMDQCSFSAGHLGGGQ
jgi:tetratricopeptide (TPR) repeat protein